MIDLAHTLGVGPIVTTAPRHEGRADCPNVGERPGHARVAQARPKLEAAPTASVAAVPFTPETLKSAASAEGAASLAL